MTCGSSAPRRKAPRRRRDDARARAGHLVDGEAALGQAARQEAEDPSRPLKPFGLVSTEFLKASRPNWRTRPGGEHRRVVGEGRIARRRGAVGRFVAAGEILEIHSSRRRREPAADQRRIVEDARVVPLAGAEEPHLVARDPAFRRAPARWQGRRRRHRAREARRSAARRARSLPPSRLHVGGARPCRSRSPRCARPPPPRRGGTRLPPPPHRHWRAEAPRRISGPGSPNRRRCGRRRRREGSSGDRRPGGDDRVRGERDHRHARLARRLRGRRTLGRRRPARG